MGVPVATRQAAVAQRADPQRSPPHLGSKAAACSQTSSIAHLQRTVGNRAISRVMQSRTHSPSGTIQPKLTVSHPEDESEREADRVAAQVMRMPAPNSYVTSHHTQPTIQRVCTECEDRLQRQPVVTLRRWPAQISRKCKKCEEKPELPSNEPEAEKVLVQAKRESGNPSEASSDLRSYLAGSRRGGQRLSDSTRAYFEPRFGHDFGRVRVHTDSRAQQASAEIGARAFTVGSNVYFGQGQYRPGSSTGDHLLGHELTHIVQQSSALEASNAMQRLQRQLAPAEPEEQGSNSDEVLCEGAEFPPAVVWFSDPMLERIRADKALMTFGSDGEPVALVQQALVAWGCDEDLGHLLPKFGVDGSFRSETRTAVETFQGRQGIEDDGIVGPITMAELDRFIPGGTPTCPSETEAVPQSDNVATLASGFEGAESESACNTQCQDEDVSLEHDPLPTPDWDVRFVHGSTMAEVFKRPEVARTNPTASPHEVLGLTVPVEPINTWRDAVTKTKLGKKLGPQCFECVVEWNLITPTVRSFVATDWAFTPEIGLWHGGPDDSCPTSPQGVMKRTPVVFAITPEALQRITFAEMEHFLDFAFAFHLVSARYLATMRRLISGRTHLRGRDQDECEAKTFLFILLHTDFIPPFLMGMAHDLHFLKTFTPSQTVRDDGRDHRVAETDPPKNRKAHRPVPRFNCFFHRNLTTESFPRVPGPGTQEVIKDLNTPPFHPWHVL